MTLTDRIEEIKERLSANDKFCKELQYAAHDKIELIAQTAAMHMSLKERLSDLAFLLEAVERAPRILLTLRHPNVSAAEWVEMIEKYMDEMDRLAKGE